MIELTFLKELMLIRQTNQKVQYLPLFYFYMKFLSFKHMHAMAVMIFFQLLYLESGFLSVAYLTIANLARLGISVHCQVSVRLQYLVRLLSQCWIAGGHKIRPPIEELLPPTGIEPTPFRNSTSKVAALQVDASTPVRHFV